MGAIASIRVRQSLHSIGALALACVACPSSAEKTCDFGATGPEFENAPIELVIPVEAPPADESKWEAWAASVQADALAAEPAVTECTQYHVQFFDTKDLEILRVRSPRDATLDSCKRSKKPDWTVKFREKQPPANWPHDLELERDVTLLPSACVAKGSRSFEKKGVDGDHPSDLAAGACKPDCEPVARCGAVAVTRWKREFESTDACTGPTRVHIEVWERDGERRAEVSYEFKKCSDTARFETFAATARERLKDRMVIPSGTKTEWATTCPAATN